MLWNYSIQNLNSLPARTDLVMQLKHLRSICEIANQDLNVTRASYALHISQPGISHHVRLLEEELGVPLFGREKRRLGALTPAGKAVLLLARRMLGTADDLGRIGRSFAKGATGSLTIATAHTYARSSLPPVITRFLKAHPQVEVHLKQG